MPLRAAVPYVLIVVSAFVATYGFLLSGWGASVASFVSSDESTVEQLLSRDPCPGDQASSFSCWDTYYATITNMHGPRVALFDLKKRYEVGGYARLYCHTLLHPIGEAAGVHYGSVAEAYKHGDPFCRSGYYHGVLEGIFGEAGGDELLSRLDTICAAVPGKERYSYDYFACVHGIGHGLMSFFDHDLFQPLAGCDRLSGAWEQSSCYGGVFMENIISDTPEEPSKFLKRDDLRYPCTIVEPHQQKECYQMQTSHMLSVLQGDFKKTFQLCASLDAPHRTSCFQSIGRDASGWSEGSIKTAVAFCAQGMTEEQQRECIVGVAADAVQSLGVDAAYQLCREVPAESVQACTEIVEYHSGTL